MVLVCLKKMTKMIVVMILIMVGKFINMKRMNILFEDLEIDLQDHSVEIHQEENRMKKITKIHAKSF